MTPIERMRVAVQYVEEYDIEEFTGPAPEKEIARIEKKLGVPITGSYREFIQLLGSQNDSGFCGVNMEYKDAGTVWGTELMRREYSLPAHCLVVWVDEAAQEGCIMDCSEPQTDGEFPVYWVFFSHWQEMKRRVANSFVEFFEHYFNLGPGTGAKSAGGKKKNKTGPGTTRGKQQAKPEKKAAAKKKTPSTPKAKKQTRRPKK